MNLTAKHIIPFDFKSINVGTIESTLDDILRENRSYIKSILSLKDFSWDSLLEAFDDLSDKLHFFWGRVSHLNSVMSTDSLRDAHNRCLPKLSEYFSEIGHNKEIYDAVKSIKDKREGFSKLDEAQRKVIDNELRDFRLSGVALPSKKKEEFAKLQINLSNLTSKFADNLLDATNSWTYFTENGEEFSGLPDYALKSAKLAAQARKKDGFLLTLDQPSFVSAMTYLDNRDIRRKVYTAYVTRASDQGDDASKWDNTKVMEDILKCRFELARLLGFKNFAEYSLATKMADSTEQILSFLNELAERSRGQAIKDYEELKDFANIDDLKPWDFAYYSEKLKQHKYAISDEDLRPYFSEHQVIKGMFELVERLYDININQIETENVWHEDVKVFEISDKSGDFKGHLFMDLYARAYKQSGAWMNDFCSRRSNNAHIQYPIAFIACNFNSPVDDESLLTHSEVVTLFHEFGHSLQHLLTNINYSGVSGVNGVPWDAVELASQFMENWCFEKPIINMISKHYKTGASLPDVLYERMLDAKNFQSGLGMLRQIEFAVFDLRLHVEFTSGKNQIQNILRISNTNESATKKRHLPFIISKLVLTSSAPSTYKDKAGVSFRSCTLKPLFINLFSVNTELATVAFIFPFMSEDFNASMKQFTVEPVPTPKTKSSPTNFFT